LTLPTPPEDDRLLTTHDVAADSGLSTSFFEKARLTGDGPPFIQIGRAIRYRRSEYLRWRDARPSCLTIREMRLARTG
jgi:predicted DNA-binding transcriptional regulator AlpA